MEVKYNVSYPLFFYRSGSGRFRNTVWIPPPGHRGSRWSRAWGQTPGRGWHTKVEIYEFVVIVKSWVNLLTWLLIGCSLLWSQSGVSMLVDPTLDYESWVNLLTWLLIGCSHLCSQSGASLLFDTTLNYESWVNLLTWLLIGYSHLCSQSDASLLFDPNLDIYYNS